MLNKSNRVISLYELALKIHGILEPQERLARNGEIKGNFELLKRLNNENK